MSSETLLYLESSKVLSASAALGGIDIPKISASSSQSGSCFIRIRSTGSRMLDVGADGRTLNASSPSPPCPSTASTSPVHTSDGMPGSSLSPLATSPSPPRSSSWIATPGTPPPRASTSSSSRGGHRPASVASYRLLIPTVSPKDVDLPHPLANFDIVDEVELKGYKVFAVQDWSVRPTVRLRGRGSV